MKAFYVFTPKTSQQQAIAKQKNVSLQKKLKT